jgi:glycine oxidase
MNADLAIIGGGAVGLALADCALREGLSVAVYDRGEPGREASWAGAGMLTARPRPRHKPGLIDYHDLSLYSVQLHSEWAQRLLSETGIDVGYRVSGALEVILPQHNTPEDQRDQESLLAGAAERGVRARRIGADEAKRLEPALTGEIAGAIEFPDEAQIRNPRFVRALLASVVAKGGAIHANAEIADVLVSGGKARGLIMKDGREVSTGKVAVCAGAWSAQFPSLVKAAPAVAKVEPVRGQILRYETHPKFATRVLTCDRHYIVPRGDGVVLVGATQERAGFIKEATAEGRAELEGFAHALVQYFSDLQPIQHWAGLRPGLKGKHPLLGPVLGVEGLYIALGHFRNGLTLAPASAQLVIDSIFNRTGKIPVKPWLVS